ncbi:MAG: pyridoxamine 5'-phosphate oxidase [Actinomycetota bacterium]
MSIKVPLDELADTVAGRGPGYLLTAGGGRPHVMHVSFEADGSVLRAPVGRSAAANIGAQPAVTLLWPPADDGYSLIVDAEAVVEGDPEGDTPPTVVATATGAVLHRPAPAS